VASSRPNSNEFYCGIDLHARLLAICLVDHETASVVCRTQIPADKQMLLDSLAPYRADVVVAVECLFAWYWVADLCAKEGIPFVLGHALYMKAIHGGKAKNDDIDADKIARLLRGGNIPVAYVYSKGLRATRDLLRRRMHLVHQRAGLITHIQILGLTMLYEIHDIRRFKEVGEFLSYARLIRCTHESSGKKLGIGGAKIGNASQMGLFRSGVPAGPHYPGSRPGRRRRRSGTARRRRSLPGFR
jgi:hypothetical protein